MVLSVTSQKWSNPVALDAVARIANPAVVGTSTGPSFSLVHLPDGASDVEVNVINSMFASFDTLSPVALPLVIPADDVSEAVITLNIADVEVDWLVLDSAGVVVGSGTEASVAGVVTLEFSTSVADVYEVWIIRKIGDFDCGHASVTVTEV